MSYKIIVARYDEDIQWLRSEMINCIIYNKGTRLGFNNEIILENVGRESETYLQYIITNYDNLPDVVVFTQARISDHKGSDDVNYLINIKNQALSNGKSDNLLIHNDIDNRPITFIEWFKTNISADYPNPIKIYCNAIFAVRKEYIINKPIDYYKKLVLEVNHHNNPSEGHFFERSWYYIFD
jgi:hypothetical protein